MCSEDPRLWEDDLFVAAEKLYLKILWANFTMRSALTLQLFYLYFGTMLMSRNRKQGEKAMIRKYMYLKNLLQRNGVAYKEISEPIARIWQTRDSSKLEIDEKYIAQLLGYYSTDEQFFGHEKEASTCDSPEFLSRLTPTAALRYSKSEATRCMACGSLSAAEVKLLTCSRCRGAFYCNKDCQKKHWATHKPTCSQVAS